MNVSPRTVVTIDYTLTDDVGQIIDSSKGGEPLTYLHGFRNIIPGLENALEGRSTGDRLSVTIAPDVGYGERDEELIQAVSRDLFENADQIEVGMQFQSVSEEGLRMVTVIGVSDDQITIDANHPLAGATLNFDVTVMDIREATAEELEHGHAHGADDHDHE